MITKQQFWRRVDMRTRLKAGQVFDVVIIGAGATGLGIAVDAASRGLSVAVLDAQDFCAGTSSRSTKLIHGGVRYLSNPRNWPLIKEALFERRLLLQNAPQLVRPQSFVVPCYSYAQALWYGAGLGLYSLLSSGGKGMHGVTLSGLNEICKQVLAEGCRKLGLIDSAEKIGTYYMHGVSHHLGIDVHDVSARRDEPLQPGAVITDEPGLYIDEWETGIRIEDDLLITEDGCEVLSADVIREADEIEAFMAQAKRG